MKLRRNDFLPLVLLSSCFVFVWGCGGNSISEETQLSSTAVTTTGNAGFSVPFSMPGEKSAPDSQASSADNIEDVNAPAPAIIYSLDQIERGQQANSLMQFHNMAGNRNCEGPECKDIANPKYMTCNRQNDYLEKEMEGLGKKSGLMAKIINSRVNSQAIIKPACMRMSMEAKFGISSKNFRQCSASNNMSSAFRPCISENYFKMISNSFNVVSTCLKDYMSPGASDDVQNLDVRAAYAMINIESGFHVNAMSGTGAGGIGQLTGPAITDSNKTEMSKVRAALEQHSNPTCAQLSHEFLDSKEPMRADKGASCDRISIKKGNPVLNMIYSYAYLKWSKNAMNRVVLNDKRYKNKFKMSDYEKQKIQRALMVWSHNTGPAGTWTPAMTLLNTVYRNKPVTSAETFISELQQYMKKFPARANKSSARRTETSKYFPGITNLLNNIEKNVGGGSCVN
jgi:hypothetical protein